MSDIITERSGNILRIQWNRPERKNAMTSAMYVTLADLLNNAAKDDQIRVVRWNLRTRNSPFASVRPTPRKHSTHFSQSAGRISPKRTRRRIQKHKPPNVF